MMFYDWCECVMSVLGTTKQGEGGRERESGRGGGEKENRREGERGRERERKRMNE